MYCNNDPVDTVHMLQRSALKRPVLLDQAIVEPGPSPKLFHAPAVDQPGAAGPHVVPCDFCPERDVRSAGTNNQLYFPHDREIVAETEHFQLVVDIAPIAVGHLLILSKGHFSSMAMARRGNETEFDTFVKDVRTIYQSEFRGWTTVEHGSDPLEPEKSACITHAHVHILPFGNQLAHYFLSDMPAATRAESQASALDWAARIGGAYILYADNFQTLVAYRQRPFHRHFARSLVGRHLRVPAEQWDWALFRSREMFARSQYLSVKAFAQGGYRP